MPSGVNRQVRSGALALTLALSACSLFEPSPAESPRLKEMAAIPRTGPAAKCLDVGTQRAWDARMNGYSSELQGLVREGAVMNCLRFIPSIGEPERAYAENGH